MVILKNGYAAAVLEDKKGERYAAFFIPGDTINPNGESIITCVLADNISDVINKTEALQKKKYDL